MIHRCSILRSAVTSSMLIRSNNQVSRNMVANPITNISMASTSISLPIAMNQSILLSEIEAMLSVMESTTELDEDDEDTFVKCDK